MINVYKDVEHFLSKYEDFLQSDEIRYSLVYRIIKRNTGVTLLIASEKEDTFVFGVLAGKNLIIGANTLDKERYEELVNEMSKIDYPGIIGSKEHCEIYHSVFQEITGEKLYTKMDQRIYSCEKVNDYSANIGTVRLATPKDIEYLVEWAYYFSRDVEEDTTMEYARNSVTNKIQNKALFVLVVNGKIVSMAGRASSKNHTESVGYVYTPEEERRKGYASIVVEHVTKEVLKDGKLPTLYTDLSNPTSNSIYMKIGYVPYCDSVMMNKLGV